MQNIERALLVGLVRTTRIHGAAGLKMAFCVAILLICLGVAVPPAQASTAIRGQLVLDIGSGWESRGSWRPSVIHNGSSFLMWYSGEDDQHVDNIGLATSTDAISWVRYGQNPALRVGAIGEWDSSSVMEPWVIFENGEYKMWYSGQKVANKTLLVYEIGYATSTDGMHWVKYPANPILTASPSAAFDDQYVFRPVVLSTGSSYQMYYWARSREGMTSNWSHYTGLASSSDGVHWTKRGSPIAIPPSSSGLDANGGGVGGVNRRVGVYLLSYYGTFPDSDQAWQIGFANSTDGITWNPYPDNPVITHGPAGSWDEARLSVPMMLAIDEEYYVYYDSGRRIGLAVLPIAQYAIPEFSSTEFIVLVLSLVSFVCVRRRREVLGIEQ